jgi:hypothetical protein
MSIDPKASPANPRRRVTSLLPPGVRLCVVPDEAAGASDGLPRLVAARGDTPLWFCPFHARDEAAVRTAHWQVLSHAWRIAREGAGHAR